MLRFQIRSGPQFRHFSVDFTGPLEGGRVVSVGRVGSAVCFFVLILNNAPALRAGKNVFAEILREVVGLAGKS